MDATSNATWNGPFIGELVTGGQIVTVHPGDQAQVTEQDLQSGHWTPVGQPAPTTPAYIPPAPTPVDDEQEPEA